MPPGQDAVAAAVLLHAHATSRRQALQTLSEAAAHALGLEAKAVFEAAMRRERLGGTGLSEGVALPHGRLPGLKRAGGVLARFEQPIDFGALDGRPCDLVYLLLTPAERSTEHLKALARLTRLFKRPVVRERLRAARSAEALRAALEGGADGALRE